MSEEKVEAIVEEEVKETPEKEEVVMEEGVEGVEVTDEVEKVKEEVVEEEVVAQPEAPKEEPAVLQEAHRVLRAWKQVYDEQLPKAEDAHYYAEELFCEDQKFWDQGKHKVRRGEWTVEQFDEELQALKKKQDPVWDILLKQVAEISTALEQPAKDVNSSSEKVIASIGPHPFNKILRKATPTPEEQEVRHEYHWKLQQEFKDAKAQYQKICGYPEGLLSRVKLFRINVVREDINIAEALHDKEKNKGKNIFKNLPLVGKQGA